MALVDIGAGTTDIAITKDGQIIAYAMTSTAGDEVTEELAKAFLLDFNRSEELKVRLSENQEHKFTDVVGSNYNLTTPEIIEKIQPIIDRVSAEIAEKIIEYNGKSPNAVFLIGGSSQLPGLKDKIAEKLGLPSERVSIRDAKDIGNIEGLKEKGPNMITPIGIALEGAKDSYKNFIRVNFNGEDIRLFNMETIKVSDVLVITKFPPKGLLPKRRETFTYYLNDKKIEKKGKEGSPPKILINGIAGSLQTKITNDVEIKVTPSKLDESDEYFLYDIIPREKNIYI